MKKNNLILAALAATSMVGSAPLKADTLKEKATQRFNTSINRFRKCIRGKCTKMEALKLSRDVAITAAAVIAAMYGIGEGLKRGSEQVREGLGLLGPGQTRPIHKAGEWLQKPVTVPQKAWRKMRRESR